MIPRPDFRYTRFDVDKKVMDCLYLLVDEVNKLQKRVSELEEHHIHYQDVFVPGVTGGPVFRIKEDANA